MYRCVCLPIFNPIALRKAKIVHKGCILMSSEGASYYKKVKVSHNLIAVGQWGLESHCSLGTADERRSPSLSFLLP